MLSRPVPGAERNQAPTPPVDVNSASRSELETLPSIGVERAKLIVRMRERNGPFRNIEELQALPRLSKKQFEALRQAAIVGADPVKRVGADAGSKPSR